MIDLKLLDAEREAGGRVGELFGENNRVVGDSFKRTGKRPQFDSLSQRVRL